jgi:hypothetical protein
LHLRRDSLRLAAILAASAEVAPTAALAIGALLLWLLLGLWLSLDRCLDLNRLLHLALRALPVHAAFGTRHGLALGAAFALSLLQAAPPLTVAAVWPIASILRHRGGGDQRRSRHDRGEQ